MWQLVEELGLLGYIKQYPVNPITIVGGVVVIGVIVLFINASVRRRKATYFVAEHPGAAIVALHRDREEDWDYAENISIQKLNGETAHWFFLKPGIAALYVPAGENNLELYAHWARQAGGVIKMFKTEVATIKVIAERKGCYSLEYFIPEDRFIFSEYKNEFLFGR